MHSVRAEERDRGPSRTRRGRGPETSGVIIGRDGLIERCPPRAQYVEKRGQDDNQRDVENHGIKGRVERESTAPMHARRGKKRKTFMETTSEKSALSV